MFSHILYFNEERILEYTSIVTKKENIQMDEVTTTNENNSEVNAKYLKGNKKSTETYKGKVLHNLAQDYTNFIEVIKDNDFFIDFLNNQDNKYDSHYLSKNSIIQFESTIKIPSKFDIIKLLDKLNIKEQILSECSEKGKNIFEPFLEMKNTKIPIIIKINDYLATGKINSNNLICEYQELEELEYEEIVILAKVISPKCPADKPIFNPLTDFMSIDRKLRDSPEIFKDIPEELEKIFIEEDYANLEILAIYQ